MRLFKRKPEGRATVHVAPEFGVRVTLRKGDKIVRRDATGTIRVTTVSGDRVEEVEVLRLTALEARGRRRPR